MSPIMIATRKGARRKVPDLQLSRYARYLIVQNGDPEKPIIALGQTHFAAQTRREELADEAALAGLTEGQRRIFVRKELAGHNRRLAVAAADAGVVTDQDFAAFQDHRYMGRALCAHIQLI
jgi:DNA-damage-inducible protein D